MVALEVGVGDHILVWPRHTRGMQVQGKTSSIPHNAGTPARHSASPAMRASAAVSPPLNGVVPEGGYPMSARLGTEHVAACMLAACSERSAEREQVKVLHCNRCDIAQALRLSVRAGPLPATPPMPSGLYRQAGQGNTHHRQHGSWVHVTLGCAARTFGARGGIFSGGSDAGAGGAPTAE